VAGEELTFAATREDDAVVVTLAGELEMSATFWLEPELERLAGDADVSALVLDMREVSFLDSAALGMLLSTQARLQAAGKRLVVANASGAVRRILGVTGTADVLGID
jgi:anti-anti-sigma factor